MQNEFPTAHLVKCRPLQTPKPNEKGNYENTSLGDLIIYTKELQVDYNECAIRNDALVDLILKENENIRENNKKLLK